MAAGSLTLPIPFPDPTLRLYTHQTLKMSRLQLDVPPLSCIWIRSRASVVLDLPNSCVCARARVSLAFHRRRKTTSSRKGKSTYARTVASKNGISGQWYILLETKIEINFFLFFFFNDGENKFFYTLYRYIYIK